jgi:hypothetical protein
MYDHQNNILISAKFALLFFFSLEPTRGSSTIEQRRWIPAETGAPLGGTVKGEPYHCQRGSLVHLPEHKISPFAPKR